MKQFMVLLAAAAASLTLCACGAQSPAAPTANPAPAVSMMPQGSKYVDVTGALLPLTTGEAHEGLTARRALTLDFSGSAALAEVTDAYTLMNETAQDMDILLCYPLAGSLDAWDGAGYAVTVNASRTEVGVKMSPGGTTADRYKIYEDQFDPLKDEVMGHLKPCYPYERSAAPAPDLSGIMVRRYRVTDIRSDSALPEDARLCLAYQWSAPQGKTIDYGSTASQTTMLCDDVAEVRYLLSMEDAERFTLTVIGGELTDYTLTGYASADCAEGTELPALTAALKAEELPLSEVLDETAEEWLKMHPSETETELFSQALAMRIADEVLDAAYPRHTWEYFLNTVSTQERIFWLTIPVTLPAGGEVSICVEFDRCGGEEFNGPAAREGVYHYDLLPNYGTTLNLSDQVIRLAGGEDLTIIQSETGEALREGLHPTEEFYHFSVEKRNR